MTGFEPATTRPPDVYSTGLSYIPKNDGAKVGEKIEICKCFEGKMCAKNLNLFFWALSFCVWGFFCPWGEVEERGDWIGFKLWEWGNE